MKIGQIIDLLTLSLSLTNLLQTIKSQDVATRALVTRPWTIWEVHNKPKSKICLGLEGKFDSIESWDVESKLTWTCNDKQIKV
jgi:hypothetical protein